MPVGADDVEEDGLSDDVGPARAQEAAVVKGAGTRAVPPRPSSSLAPGEARGAGARVPVGAWVQVGPNDAKEDDGPARDGSQEGSCAAPSGSVPCPRARSVPLLVGWGGVPDAHVIFETCIALGIVGELVRPRGN